MNTAASSYRVLFPAPAAKEDWGPLSPSSSCRARHGLTPVSSSGWRRRPGRCTGTPRELGISGRAAERKGAEVSGGAEGGRSFLLSPRRRLTDSTGGGQAMDVTSNSHHKYFLWVLLSPSLTSACFFRACCKQEEVDERKRPLRGSQIPYQMQTALWA